MKIWKLNAEVDLFDNLKTVEKWSLATRQSFDGRKKESSWKAEKVVRLEPEKGLRLSDTPWLDSMFPIFSDRVKIAMEGLIGNAVEFLPLVCDEGDFWIVNVINVLDCVDCKKSKIVRFNSSGKILTIEKYIFIEDIVKEEDIFKFKDDPLVHPFVSDRFKELIESNGFEGFKFELLWDSETE